jgi:hypothetical protein
MPDMELPPAVVFAPLAALGLHDGASPKCDGVVGGRGLVAVENPHPAVRRAPVAGGRGVVPVWVFHSNPHRDRW